MGARWTWPTALAFVCAARLALAGSVGIVDDEAYYWAWGRVPAFGYFDHPPAVAWFIRASDLVFGATSLGVRAGCVIAGVLTCAALLPLARDRVLLGVALFSAPLYALGGLLATPDAPLALGWALALLGASRGVWTLAGLGVGIACLGKVTGWGLWPLLLMADPRGWRGALRGMLVTAVVTAPHVAWLAQHDWVSVRFQLGHGLDPNHGGNAGSPGLGGSLGFLAAQVGLVGPITFGAAFAWWASSWRCLLPGGDRTDRALWVTSLGPLVFFTLAAAIARGEANWAAPAWLGALAGVARAGGRVARAGYVGAFLSFVLCAAVVVHLFRPWLPIPVDVEARLGAQATLAQSVQGWGVEPVYTERYQEAATLRYHAGIDAYALPGAGRPDQFDLWAAPDAERALFVRPWRGGPTLPTDVVCAERGSPNVVTARAADGSPVDRWQVYEVGRCVLGAGP